MPKYTELGTEGIEKTVDGFVDTIKVRYEEIYSEENFTFQEYEKEFIESVVYRNIARLMKVEWECPSCMEIIEPKFMVGCPTCKEVSCMKCHSKAIKAIYKSGRAAYGEHAAQKCFVCRSHIPDRYFPSKWISLTMIISADGFCSQGAINKTKRNEAVKNCFKLAKNKFNYSQQLKFLTETEKLVKVYVDGGAGLSHFNRCDKCCAVKCKCRCGSRTKTRKLLKVVKWNESENLYLDEKRNELYEKNSNIPYGWRKKNKKGEWVVKTYYDKMIMDEDDDEIGVVRMTFDGKDYLYNDDTHFAMLEDDYVECPDDDIDWSGRLVTNKYGEDIMVLWGEMEFIE